MVDGRYVGDWGFTVDTGLKIFAGRIPMGNAAVQSVTGTVVFPSLFSAGCQPIISTSILAASAPVYEHVVNGIGTYYPDYRGFQFRVRINKAYPNQTMQNDIIYLMYICMGY
jgi:hypothetical protein